MKAGRTLLLFLLFAGAIGSTFFLLQSTLLARQRIVENAASVEKPTTAIDVVTTESKRKPVSINKPFATETGSLKTKQVVRDKFVERRGAEATTDRTREAIKSFQETAELLTARFDLDVISGLGLEVSETSLDR
jgi:hypothetical protein